MNGWIKRWAVVGVLLAVWVLVAWAYAGEPPFRETARVTLGHRFVEESKPVAFTNNIWQSVGDGNWENTSNWTLGVQPGATHIAIFDKTSSISVTTNLDQTASPFEQLLVKPGYGGNIGSQGNPLIVTVAAAVGTVVWRGRGQGFIAPAFGSDMNLVCDVRHGFQANRYDLVIGGTGTAAAGTVLQVGVKRGNCNIMGDVHFGAQTYILGDAARLVIDANLGVLAPNHIICAAGELINHQQLGNDDMLIVADRSRVTQIGALRGGGNPNHVVVIGSGKFRYLPTSAPGTSPLLSVIGGVYDQTDEKWDNVWGTVVLGPDALIIGGAVRGTGVFPPDINFGDEYPGAKE